MKNNDAFVIIKGAPNEMKLRDGEDLFGVIREITSKTTGAKNANVAEVILWRPDILHFHKKAEETYFCRRGEGEIFIGDKVIDFLPGTRVIIRPGTLHAARPKLFSHELSFLCVASPCFDPSDVIEDPRRREW